jgi:hypothetical protein
MQRYKIFFITVNAPHVSGGFSAHRAQTVHTASGISKPGTLPGVVYTVLELLMMGGETARNM